MFRGEKIKEMRKQHKMSVESLAKMMYIEGVDVSGQTIRNWESNKSCPNAERIKSLCDIFGIELNYLVENDGAS